MKILHTADWHLGRRLKHWELLDEQRLFLDQLLATLEREGVELLLIAGDFFDRSQPGPEALDLARDFFSRLAQLDCQTVLIAGNHDSPELLSFASVYARDQGLYIRSKLDDFRQPLSFGSGDERVHCYALPYLRRGDIEEELGQSFASFDEAFSAILAELDLSLEGPKVLLAHQFVAGAELSESERSTSVGTAQALSRELFRDFSYCALGHLHRPQSLGPEDWRLRYAGSPLAYSLSEAGQEKSWTLFRSEGGQLRDFYLLPIQARRQVQRLQGTAEEVLDLGRRLQAGERQMGPRGAVYNLDDYYFIDLELGEGPRLEARQLAQIFPRFLGLRQLGLGPQSEQYHAAPAELETQSPWELCQQLYRQKSDSDLDDWSRHYVQQLLKSALEEVEV